MQLVYSGGDRDKTVGGEFETGLANLKTLAESARHGQ
jgi:hypothetical protein